MLDVLRRSQRWLMGAAIVILAGVFIGYLGLGGSGMGGPSGSDALVQLGDRRYSEMDLQRIREDQEARLRESLGEGFDAVAAGPYLDQMAAQQLIQRAVLASEAERLGLRATDDEVRQLVRNYFRTPEGTIDAQAAREFGERRYGSERRFANEIRDELLTNKLLDLIDAGVAVSDAEARDAVRYRREEVRLAIVVLDPAKPPAALPVEDAEVEGVLADSERVRRFYDEHADRYHVPERVRARHVLLRIDKDAPEEKVAEVRRRAEQALERVRKGEDFAAVAGELSEDPGSKGQGGDLGFFPRGQMVPAFEEVAFALEPGQTSEVVRTDFGFHVIRVEAHEAAQDKSLDEVARSIAEELVRDEKARSLADEKSAKLAEKVRSGVTLVEAARALDVPIDRPDWIARRRDGLVPGVGAAPDVLTAAFALTPEKPTSERVFDVEGKKVLIELLERRGPTPEEIAKDLPTERERLVEARRAQARTDWLQAARTRLQQEGRLVVDLTPIEQRNARGAG
jgi:peptidyl-prolyl cis-trans isomerase D